MNIFEVSPYIYIYTYNMRKELEINAFWMWSGLWITFSRSAE
jgi:hypothetical protein